MNIELYYSHGAVGGISHLMNVRWPLQRKCMCRTEELNGISVLQYQS